MFLSKPQTKSDCRMNQHLSLIGSAAAGAFIGWIVGRYTLKDSAISFAYLLTSLVPKTNRIRLGL